jgi:4-diphosphocytidyl-2-C-methyl-D-erythritol kinase
VSTYRAYAKINLGLRIIEKRPDGYHNIETVFHKIDLFDEIEFSSSATIRVASTSDEAPGDESNICYKAARMLRDHFGIREGVCISIHKRIPVGAGLGGGSSDAAVVLQRLPAFWNIPADEKTLAHVARRLGADVPFFLGSSSAVGSARGDVLEYVELDIPYFILVCCPLIHVSTTWAYQQVTPSRRGSAVPLREIVIDGMQQPVRLVEELENDFEAAVFARHPELRWLKETMLEEGAVYASMSGSGSSVYGLFEREEAAVATAAHVSTKGCSTSLTPPHFKP